MIKIDIHSDCDNRKVVIQRNKDGEWVTCSQVFACSHQAGEAFLDMMIAAIGSIMAGIAPVSLLPRLEDFQLAYIDELPEHIVDDVPDTTQACELLNKLKNHHG